MFIRRKQFDEQFEDMALRVRTIERLIKERLPEPEEKRNVIVSGLSGYDVTYKAVRWAVDGKSKLWLFDAEDREIAHFASGAWSAVRFGGILEETS